ncbi:Neurotransmitter-gated ion-channel transmembrane region [Oesophagostomum dentatum]|uniref:Neurotransmitter-gated ion-channel transmembrane region n=1 Tax=Oesophagostomum dentatum TaxID=61180 RepID=A0A0B1SAM1_OESDE|nr:Neurotransmitter-gated ion-channel transmembrane region [Oesophagostomum dentatum]
MTPTTSESIPLLGIFFSSVTLIVAMSTTFTVCVLNVRYRQYANAKMSPLCALRDGDLQSSWNELRSESSSALCLALQSIPGEKLELSRKVGEGLFVPRKCQSSRKRKMERCERYVNRCRELAAEGTPESQLSMLTLDLYVAISRRIGKLRERLDHSVAKRESMEDWKFAALVLDRLCLYMFAVLFVVCTVSIFFMDPVRRAKPHLQL